MLNILQMSEHMAVAGLSSQGGGSMRQSSEGSFMLTQQEEGSGGLASDLLINIESSLCAEKERVRFLEGDNERLKRELARYKARGGLVPAGQRPREGAR